MTGTPIETGADHAHAHPAHTGHRRFDIIMAVSAIFISAVSLAVAVEHGRTERDLVAANSWPFLRAQLTNEALNGKALAIGVSNGGVGPAKIKTFEMFLDGVPVSSPGDLLQRCCKPRNGPTSSPTLPMDLSNVNETVLRPGEENSIILIRKSPDYQDVIDRFDKALLRVSFRVCYCSVLDQCWRSDLVTTNTPPVAVCPPAEHPYIYNKES